MYYSMVFNRCYYKISNFFVMIAILWATGTPWRNDCLTPIHQYHTFCNFLSSFFLFSLYCWNAENFLSCSCNLYFSVSFLLFLCFVFLLYFLCYFLESFILKTFFHSLVFYYSFFLFSFIPSFVFSFFHSFFFFEGDLLSLQWCQGIY